MYSSFFIKNIVKKQDDVELKTQRHFFISPELLLLFQMKFGSNWQEKLRNKTIKIPHCPLYLCNEYDSLLTTHFENNFYKNTILDYKTQDEFTDYFDSHNKKQIYNDLSELQNNAKNGGNIVKMVALYAGYKTINAETNFFNESASKVFQTDFNVADFLNKPVFKYKANTKHNSYKNFYADIDKWVDYNVSLIRDIKTDTAKKVKNIIVKNFKTGDLRSSEMINDLIEATEYSKTRVKRIARDQIGKLYGQKNKQQALALGLKKYKWRTCLDERVRESHKDREGNMYVYDEGINPGEEINCRCSAESVCIWEGY